MSLVLQFGTSGHQVDRPGGPASSGRLGAQRGCAEQNAGQRAPGTGYEETPLAASAHAWKFFFFLLQTNSSTCAGKFQVRRERVEVGNVSLECEQNRESARNVPACCEGNKQWCWSDDTGARW